MNASSVVDTRKQFNFAIELDGLIVDLVKSVTLPEQEFNKVEQTGPDGLIDETPGRYKFSEITIEKYLPADTNDIFFEQWFENQKNTPPSSHRRNFTVHHLGSDHQTIIDSWNVEGAWITKLTPPKNDRGSDDDSIETIAIRCRKYTRTGVSIGANIASAINSILNSIF